MSNVKVFDVGHSNKKHQNDLNVNLFDVNLFDVPHSNAKFQNYMNVKHQAVWCQNDNDINVEHQTIYVRHLNDERQNVLTFECGTSNSLMFDIKMSHSNNEHQIISYKNIMLSYIYPFSEITQI